MSSFRWLVAVGLLPIGMVASDCAFSQSGANEFQPVRQRLAASIDTNMVDIEVVGSTSLVRKFHKLIPELVLRLRLERAYVDLYAEPDPGFEILSIGVDFKTASPIELFERALAGPRFNKDVPDTPNIQPAELRRRNVVLAIHSDLRAEKFREFGQTLAQCRGEVVDDRMWVYERRTSCLKLISRKFGRVAQLDDGSLTKVECDDVLPPSFARCEMRFPFEGFSVGLNFDRDLLPRQQEVVSFSEKFLRSKEYPPSVSP